MPFVFGWTWGTLQFAAFTRNCLICHFFIWKFQAHFFFLQNWWAHYLFIQKSDFQKCHFHSKLSSFPLLNSKVTISLLFHSKMSTWTLHSNLYSLPLFIQLSSSLLFHSTVESLLLFHSKMSTFKNATFIPNSLVCHFSIQKRRSCYFLI